MTMKARYLFGMLATAAIPIATPAASACRMFQAKDEALAKFDGVVVVAVETGKRIENPGWNTWELTARGLEAIAGPAHSGEYRFTTTQSSNGCGITPLPTEGEKWVVYYDSPAPAQIKQAFPLALARKHDPRLATVQ